MNRLDRELKSLFDSVAITESSARSGVQLDLALEKSINGKRVAIACSIPKHQAGGQVVPWSYLADTRDPSGHMVEMASGIDRLAADMLEVVSRSRLDRSYLESLPDEPTPDRTDRPEDIRTEVVRLVERMGMETVGSRTACEDGLMVEVSTFRGDLRASDASRVSMALGLMDGVSQSWEGGGLVVKRLI